MSFRRKRRRGGRSGPWPSEITSRGSLWHDLLARFADDRRESGHDPREERRERVCGGCRLLFPIYPGTISCVEESHREWLVLWLTSSASMILGTIFGMDLDSVDAWVGGEERV